MPHRIIILPSGEAVVDDDRGGEGNRQTESTTFKDLLRIDHAPSEITFQGLNLEQANKLLKFAEKLYKHKD